jgi:serine/threonine protein kinase
MAPEQWADAHTCDARADLYSLGCTLYFLLIGHAPYHTHRTAANKMKGHIADPIPELQQVRPDAPPALVAIYEKLMAKQPENRFASADDLAEALAPFTSSNGTAIPPVPAKTSFQAIRTLELSATPSENTVAWKPAPSQANPPNCGSTSRKRLFALACAAAAFALLGVIMVTITNQKEKTKLEVRGQQIELSQNGKSLVNVSTAEVPEKTGLYDWPADIPKPAVAPFDAVQAKRHQEEWAAYLKVPVEYTNSIDMKFRLIARRKRLKKP